MSRYNEYHMSYGYETITATSIKDARLKAKELAERVKYAIKIVRHGTVLETWTPVIRAGSVTRFRRTFNTDAVS